MSLATRLSAFLLLALALVLAGFSVSLHLLSRSYLVRQSEDRLKLALDTLEAAVDIEPGGLEWEPTDRRILLGTEPGVDAVRWAVRDGRGVFVDRSANSSHAAFPAAWVPPAWPRDPADGTIFGAAPGWRLAARQLRLDVLLRQGRGHPDDEPGYETQYPALVLVVGLSPEPVQAALGRLRWTLSLLSLGIWAAAASVGRWLSLRALAPVTQMARAATAMTAADLGVKLPVPGTGDELAAVGIAFNDLLGRLHEAFVRLHDAYEHQHRFAGDASHQLRTPLTALLGQVQVALRRERTPEEYRRTLSLVWTEAERLRSIIESLLFLAHPERAPLEPSTIDLAQWLPDHLDHWSAHPRAIDLHLELEAQEPLPVKTHSALLAQILDNLWENACKYSVSGTPIIVRLCRDDATVIVRVEDRGLGLAPDDAARVFEPFFRAEQVRREGCPGVGLGLAVAQRIAGTFGGSIAVHSELGVGSGFDFRLPLVSSGEESSDEAVGPPSECAAELNAHGAIFGDTQNRSLNSVG